MGNANMKRALDAVISGASQKSAARFFMVDLRGLKREIRNARATEQTRVTRVAEMHATVSNAQVGEELTASQHPP